MKQIMKYIFLWFVGGITYFCIEIVYRGYSHWTMFTLGGLCFIALGLINELLSWEMLVLIQCLIGATIITILEFITGCIVNIWLGWNIWDYSSMPYNIFGQVCPQFFIIWIFISLIGIILDDYLRHWLFNEEQPRYRLY